MLFYQAKIDNKINVYCSYIEERVQRCLYINKHIANTYIIAYIITYIYIEELTIISDM